MKYNVAMSLALSSANRRPCPAESESRDASRRIGQAAVRTAVVWIAACGLQPAALGAEGAELTQSDVFTEGEASYHTFRIPAMVVSKRGTILAFCEARKGSSADHGDIDLVLKRSFDNGRTWGPLQIVHEEGGTARIAIGNPAPLVERETGAVHLLFTRDNRQVFHTRSTDDGAHFYHPKEITAAFEGFRAQLATDVSKTGAGHKSDGLSFQATRLATGPGHAIQTSRGRFLVPVWLNSYHPYPSSAGGPNEVIDYRYRTGVVYSDDNGLTWNAGRVITAPSGSLEGSEAMVIETSDGSLYLNLRVSDRKTRTVAWSKDGGSTWSPAAGDANLIDPVCQASIVRLAEPGDPKRAPILFANPASTRRENLTIRLSRDDAVTWPVSRLLNEGPSAYSDLAALQDGTIGCLYERGVKRAYEKITFARFNLAWLTNGASGSR
ncbi:MAG: exo-alpha-sialidase [Acidobacteria bacterium]|nr:exo-alpha-sialidase [Acidobacteriota bacterium]